MLCMHSLNSRETICLEDITPIGSSHSRSHPQPRGPPENQESCANMDGPGLPRARLPTNPEARVCFTKYERPGTELFLLRLHPVCSVNDDEVPSEPGLLQRSAERRSTNRSRTQCGSLLWRRHSKYSRTISNLPRGLGGGGNRRGDIMLMSC